MGLKIPVIDDKDYAELIDDARREIPGYDASWTDHNIHDPGITFIELFAWLAESYIYQLDQITDAHLTKYLRLMGASPEPPKTASTLVKLRGVGNTRIPKSLNGTPIPTGAQIEAKYGSEPAEVFEVDKSITLTTAHIARVISEHQEGRTVGTDANQTDGLYFLAFGSEAERGSAMYLGFDSDPFAAASHLDLMVDFYEENLEPPASHGESNTEFAEPSVGFDPSVKLAWQWCTNYSEWYRPNAWSDLTVSRDETNRLYGGGLLRLDEPPKWQKEDAGKGGEILGQEKEFVWIRCSVQQSGYEIPPQIDSIRTNTLSVSHTYHVEEEQLSRSDGESVTSALPNQTFNFSDSPVLRATVKIGGTPWQRVRDFDASGPDDTHYVLNQATGTIRFGDEFRGQVPALGQEVHAESIIYGGGTRGNVPAASNWRFVDRDAQGRNSTCRCGNCMCVIRSLNQLEPVALKDAQGGKDAETIAQTQARLERDFQIPYRAVTRTDCEYIATNTPGLRFGRAKAIVKEQDTSSDCEQQARISVIIVPFSTRARPMPSKAFLDACRCHLRKHRLLTDHIDVERPTYIGVGVKTEIRVAEGYSEAITALSVENQLDKYLHPLTGFNGEGWPFGRSLYLSDLYSEIEKVDGVDCVLDLRVDADKQATINNDTLTIDSSALLYPTNHTVLVKTDNDQCRRWS
jgi:hypothetical protein